MFRRNGRTQIQVSRGTAVFFGSDPILLQKIRLKAIACFPVPNAGQGEAKATARAGEPFGPQRSKSGPENA